MGWLNDATVRFEETPYNFDIGRMFPKIVRDVLDIQNPDGSITCTAPFAFGARPADPVCSSFLLAGWESYMHTGNIRILQEGYEGFVAWNRYLESRTVNDIAQYSYYGDWASPAYACQGEDGAVSAVTPGLLMSTGYYYFNTKLLVKIARVLEKTEDETRFLEHSKRIRKAFLDQYWDETSGKVGTGSQACQAFALWLEILPEEGRKKAALLMNRDLEEREYRITTGNLCTRYLLDMLTKYGYIESAWKILTREEYPSYGFMIQQEATTIWERFELKKNSGMNSHNHPMYGAVDYWVYAYLLGIRPMEPAFRKIRIAPYYPGALRSAQATLEIPYADVTVRWVKRYGGLHLYVTIPTGATADVLAPDGSHTVSGGFYHWYSME